MPTDYRKLLADLAAAQARLDAALAACQAQGGEMILKIRRDLDMTQKQLAEAMPMNNTYLGRLENGRFPAGVTLLLRLHHLLAERSKT